MVCDKCRCNSGSLAPTKCYGMLKIFVAIVGIILIYWFLLLSMHENEKGAVYADPMNKIVFNFPYLESCCSWWPISHFILFTFIGFLFPTCDFAAVSAGVCWELTEMAVYYAMGADRQGIKRPGSHNVEYSNSWWAGSFKDIFMNIAGFYVGKTLQHLYGKKVCVEKLGNCCECDHRENKRIDEDIRKKMKEFRANE